MSGGRNGKGGGKALISSCSWSEETETLKRSVPEALLLPANVRIDTLWEAGLFLQLYKYKYCSKT